VIIPMLVVEGMLALSIFGLPRTDALAQVVHTPEPPNPHNPKLQQPPQPPHPKLQTPHHSRSGFEPSCLGCEPFFLG